MQAAVRPAGPCAIVIAMAYFPCFWRDCTKVIAPELPPGASA